jgi:hypothetical protein
MLDNVETKVPNRSACIQIQKNDHLMFVDLRFSLVYHRISMIPSQSSQC